MATLLCVSPLYNRVGGWYQAWVMWVGVSVGDG